MTATAPDEGVRLDVFHHAPAFMWVHDDIANRTLWINDFWYTYSGRPRIEPVQETVPGVIHPDDLPGMMATWEANRRGASAYSGLARYQRHDGVYRLHRYTIRPLDGTALWYGVALDVQAERDAIDARVTPDELLHLAHASTAALSESGRRKDRLARTIWAAIAVNLGVTTALAALVVFLLRHSF